MLRSFCRINCNSVKALVGILILIPTLSFSQDRPTNPFLNLVQKLESQGHLADSLRAKKVYPELRQQKPILVEGKIFYRLNPDETQIIRGHAIDNYLGDQKNLALFKNAENIWAYFYRSQSKTNDKYIEDGIIEQWKFASNEDATQAISMLKNVYPLPFFNTQPQYIQSDRFIYVFHTRADMFSYKQKEFFNLFKELLK